LHHVECFVQVAAEVDLFLDGVEFLVKFFLLRVRVVQKLLDFVIKHIP